VTATTQPVVTIHCTDCGRDCPHEAYKDKHTGLPLILPMCRDYYEKQVNRVVRYSVAESKESTVQMLNKDRPLMRLRKSQG
jgi:hypothetical protein